jgi:hypothetical protein
MDRTEIKLSFFYDAYEYEYGDGFYPVLIKHDGFHEIEIKFSFDRILSAWRQRTGMSIDGFDGNTGQVVLQSLNEETKINGFKIFNNNYKQIFPKI